MAISTIMWFCLCFEWWEKLHLILIGIGSFYFLEEEVTVCSGNIGKWFFVYLCSLDLVVWTLILLLCLSESY